MRWIKHLTTAGEDVKVSALIDQHGAEAYGIYWLMLETIGLSMEKDSDRCELTYSELRWSQKLRCSVRKLRAVSLSMSDLGLISYQSTDNRVTIEVRNLLKYRDEYSKRSGQTRNIDTHTETDTETEVDKHPEESVTTARSAVSVIPFTDPFEKQIEEVSVRIHARHPKARRCAYSVVEKCIRQILKTHSKRHGMDKTVLLALIDSNHSESCQSPDWLNNDGQFAKALENWLAPTMDRYMVAKSRDSPSSNQPKFQDRDQRKLAEAITMQEIMRGMYDPAKRM